MSTVTISRIDAAMWGVYDCTCCGDGCDCGCVTACPVGLKRHEEFRSWLAATGRVTTTSEEQTDG